MIDETLVATRTTAIAERIKGLSGTARSAVMSDLQLEQMVNVEARLAEVAKMLVPGPRTNLPVGGLR